MKPKATIHKILLALFLLALAAWNTSCGSSTTQETTQQQTQQATQQQQKTQQKTTQQQQKTQQETTQQAAQTSPSTTTPSSEVAAQLIGTWETTSYQYGSASPGTQVLTFSDDGTLQSTSSDGSPNTNFIGQYSVLDDSQIQITPPNGESYVANYSLDGGALTLSVEGETATYQRTG